MNEAHAILVVDDEQVVLEAAAKILSLRNYNAVGVADANEALSQLQAHVFSAVLSDIMLPNMGGLQLLIATILSAQCTDTRVNQVTPALFARYPTARDFAEASLPELENMIRSTGFYHNKAVNIQACCRQIVEKHGGQVPKTMADLIALKGVGRKTANVVLGNAFGVPGMVVDTHVTRIANLLKLTKNKDAEKIERDLMEIIPKKNWTIFSHYLIFHGRRTCKARRPQCQACNLSDICPSSLI